MTILHPQTTVELADMIRGAANDGTRLEIRGGGSKSGLGAPRPDAQILDLSGFSGISDYDPAELVLTVGAGTKLTEIEAALLAQGQMLGFEPFDYGPIFGQPAGATTIGGAVAAAVAGSSRLSMGGPRDHLLGFHAVSGRAEAFIAGAKVVKNVTGFDLSKLMANSWGRLAALTELTLKVLPRPRVSQTLILRDLPPAAAYAAMTAALGASAAICAAAYIPETDNGGTITGFRIQGFARSTEARCRQLAVLLAGFGAIEQVTPAKAEAFWLRLRQPHAMPGEGLLWRINLPASQGTPLISILQQFGARWLADWGGGLLWVRCAAEPAILRTSVQNCGGHAMLVRSDARTRMQVPAMHPQPPDIAVLSEQLRRAFDPHSVFETGRFLD